METAGATHRVGPDLSDLAEAVVAPGPFLSLYLATPAAIDNAGPELGARWQGARRELAEQGAPEEVVNAVDAAVAGAHREGEGLAVIANWDGVWHVAHGQRPPARELARWAALPSLVQSLAWRQAEVPHLVVLADRVGADIVAVRPGLDNLAAQAGGDDFPVRKVAGGGWAQRRFQERAEVTWEQNAHDVADRMARLVDQVDARLIVLSGDVRAIQLVQKALPQRLRELVRPATGGRSPDGSSEHLGEQIAAHLADVVAVEIEAVLAAFVQEAGQRDRAAVGPAATIAALSKGQVEVLLVADDPDDDRVAWFGPEPAQVSLWAPDVGAMGVEEPWRGRLADVAVRAAIGTGAAVRVVEPGAVDGDLSAILRWSE